ncbi:lysis protein, partial [Escherichia coli]|uniref:lysis protein n=1 Tax=Escherichia coli TaxID=562 RepID=UPI002076F242
RADVAAGHRSLRINATCPGPVREATGTARVDNATGPQLADTVTRDYFTLRERLMTMQKQLEGAQDYEGAAEYPGEQNPADGHGR